MEAHRVYGAATSANVGGDDGVHDGQGNCSRKLSIWQHVNAVKASGLRIERPRHVLLHFISALGEGVAESRLNEQVVVICYLVTSTEHSVDCVTGDQVFDIFTEHMLWPMYNLARMNQITAAF